MTELKTIGTYATAAEAHVARLALEQLGIVAFIKDENQADGGGLGWPVDGVKLRVRADDVLGQSSVSEWSQTRYEE
jgi:hypothetical protein